MDAPLSPGAAKRAERAAAARIRRAQEKEKIAELAKPKRTDVDVMNLEAEVRQIREWYQQQSDDIQVNRENITKLRDNIIKELVEIKYESVTETQLKGFLRGLVEVLEDMKASIKETRAGLAEMRAGLAQTQAGLAETQATLKETQATLAQTQATLAAVVARQQKK